MALRRRLAAHHQLHEFLALEGQPLVEGQPRRRLDAGEVGVGRLETAPALGVLRLELFDHPDVAEHLPIPGRPRAVGDLRARKGDRIGGKAVLRSEEHTSELQSLMSISYAGFCLKKKN